MPLALFALTLSAFAIGTTEFVIVGLVPTIASDLGVSLPSAGLLVSLYALGVAVGAPVLTALTSHWNRKHLLLALMTLFIIGNLIAWLSPGYNTLIAARVLTGLAHGVFFSIGSTIATSLVSKDKEASAIAIMFTGLTVALVTGVPLGTLIGQEWGWRATFLVVSALGVIALLGSAALIPADLKPGATASLRDQAKVLAQPRLVLVYLITALGYGGNFILFTYLTPILEQVTGISSHLVAPMILLYGASVAIGNLWGGKLADTHGPIKALTVMFIGLASVLLLFSQTAYHPISAGLTIMIWGAFAFGNVPRLQVYVVQLAEKHLPNAVDVASGFNIAAFNLGIALGAAAGGLIVDSGSLMDTPWIGAAVVLLALALTRLSGALDRTEHSTAVQPLR
ncbi:MFS transporter [Ferrimonas sp. SCSIO 43195]|uniref:MFS transporter n=1 Tax=Ferrimonas sp. SCSIO 43195 TaxID=2822844 RepID=UPI0020751017|nr:MFS transporter [Ferrimonas sp. SCSIO 43195]USD38685.1 MFS transporter [Ferrimonas sp. SCSIO 43195]